MTSRERLVVSAPDAPDVSFEVQVLEKRQGDKPPKIDCPGEGLNCNHKFRIHSSAPGCQLLLNGKPAVFLCGKEDE